MVILKLTSHDWNIQTDELQKSKFYPSEKIGCNPFDNKEKDLKKIGKL